MGNIQAKFPQARSILGQQNDFPAYLFIYFETVNPKLSQALLNKGGTEILDTYLDLQHLPSNLKLLGFICRPQ